MVAVNQAAIAIFSFIIVVSALGFVLQYMDTSEVMFRQQTTDTIAERLAGDMHVLDSYPQGGQVEVDLGSDYRINVSGPDSRGMYAVNVTFGGNSGQSWIPVRSEVDSEGFRSRYVCMEKSVPGFRGEITVEGGRC